MLSDYSLILVRTSGSPAISRKLVVLTLPVVAPAVGSLFSRLIREGLRWKDL
jgi:hypothetical protein